MKSLWKQSIGCVAAFLLAAASAQAGPSLFSPLAADGPVRPAGGAARLDRPGDERRAGGEARVGGDLRDGAVGVLMDVRVRVAVAVPRPVLVQVLPVAFFLLAITVTAEIAQLAGVFGFVESVELLGDYVVLCIDEFELDDPGNTTLISRLLLLGRSATVISQALTIAAATRNMITAVVLAALTNTSVSWCHFSSR